MNSLPQFALLSAYLNVTSNKGNRRLTKHTPATGQSGAQDYVKMIYSSCAGHPKGYREHWYEIFNGDPGGVKLQLKPSALRWHIITDPEGRKLKNTMRRLPSCRDHFYHPPEGFVVINPDF